MSQALVRFLSQTEAWLGGLGLAAFVALFWVLRGAPPGQAVHPEDESDAPRGGYRDRVVAAVCLGMLLILLGAYLAVTRGVGWAIPAFAAGFCTVLALVLINQKHRHGSPTLRRTVDVASSVLNASLLAGVLVVLNVVAFRYGGRPVDMTREGAYSLSSLSVKQVMTLPRPMTFTTFFGRGRAAYQQYDRVRQLLELYRAANPENVRLDHVDPFRDLGRYEALAKRVPDLDVTQGGGVVVELGEGDAADRVVLRNTDLFEFPAARFSPDVERFESVFKGEDAVTSALIRLREAKKPKVVFTTGHGEPTADDTESSRPGLGLFAARLTGTGSQVVGVNLLTQDLPDDAALVVVAGPKTPFQPTESAKLRAFADRKGPLLMLLGDNQGTGLDDLLRGFGVELGKGFVVEPRLSLRGRVDVPVVPVVGATHPILQPLNNQYLVVPRPAPLTLAALSDPATQVAAVTPTVLLRTSAESWAEPDLAVAKASKDPGDPSGPFVVGVAVTDRPSPGDARPPAPRLVVVSSRNAADNLMVQTAPTNLDLLMNAVSWLRNKPELGGIAPKQHQALSLTADAALRARLVLVPTVMSVLLIITFGLFTYYSRRD